MIYIAGYTFKVGSSSQQMRSGSIHQQVTLKSQLPKIEEQFKIGEEYTLYHVLVTTYPTGEKAFKYTFIEKSTREKIDKIFSSTYDADNYIARISGKTEELNTERSKITSAQTDQ